MTRISFPACRSIAACLALAFLCYGGAANAEMLSGRALVEVLRQGGYVLLMRHASSPAAAPDRAGADPENTALERQLDQNGRDTAAAMGRAIRELHIPIETVLSSPTYRARETLRLAGFGAPATFAELGDGGHSMQANAVSAKAGWLREKVAEAPAPGSNTLIVTQMPNIVSAFAGEAGSLTDGEALVLKPKANGASDLVARIRIDEWSSLPR